ncbi:syntaxin-6-like isoform X1 [Branchiostoma floridae]|uniref:Syntaxin-6-like isoform X1 n=1 Tax=Branchiostoma floridae TaxID=7739 RepID=A0A9J7MYF4_BRAFL|nr:syntaxin-6-like isoform X1 [Branchiostoma floridae]
MTLPALTAEDVGSLLGFLKKELSEVQKAVQNATGLYQRWCELLEDPVSVSKEEYDWTSNELRNSLRSIEWDLEDLDETISIVESNPRKFKIDQQELADRRAFISRTRQSVKDTQNQMKTKLLHVNTSPKDNKPVKEDRSREREHLFNGPSKRQDRYTKLDSEMDNTNQKFIADTRQQQQLIVESQDDQLEMVSGSVGVLKNMSHQIGNELDEQAVMLDDLGHEIDSTQSRLDGVLKKIAKVSHMSNDKRQWTAIIVLLVIMFILIILFLTL